MNATDTRLAALAQRESRTVTADTTQARPCAVCAVPTVYIDVMFECPLHPGPCTTEMDRRWLAAERRQPAPAPPISSPSGEDACR